MIWPFYRLLKLYEQKFQKTRISASSVHKCHKSCSLPSWPFYSLLQLYEEKCHEDSYLREFCAQLSKIVFLTDFRPFYSLLELYEEKKSQNWYLRQFCAQVWQIVFLGWFDRFTAYYN